MPSITSEFSSLSVIRNTGGTGRSIMNYSMSRDACLGRPHVAPLKFGHGDDPPFPHVVEFAERIVCRHAHYVVLLRRCLAVLVLVRILDLKHGEIRRYGAGTSHVVLRSLRQAQADRHHVQLACGTVSVVLRPLTRTKLAFHGAVRSGRYIKHVMGARTKSIFCAVWLDLGVQIGCL